MAAPEVNYRPQEASGSALEPPSPQEPKPQDDALPTRREEGNEISIQTGPENIKKRQRRWQTQKFYGRSRSQFSIPRSKFWRTRTTISSRTKITRRRSVYKKRREKRIFHSKRSRKNEKNASKLQITTATTEVNSQPQEAKICTLEPPYPLEPKPQGGAPLTRREEEDEFPIQIGSEVQRQKWSSQGLCPSFGGSDHKRSSSRKCTNYRQSSSCSKSSN